jgi:hypothetical protein
MLLRNSKAAFKPNIWAKGKVPTSNFCGKGKYSVEELWGPTFFPPPHNRSGNFWAISFFIHKTPIPVGP